jgi:subtilisin family serine protease
MPNKYKHIKLPVTLFGGASDHVFHKQGRARELPGFEDMGVYKEGLRVSAAKLSTYARETTPKKRTSNDRNFVDFKIKVQGPLKEEWFTKYNLKLEARYDDRAAGQDYQNDTIIARLPNDKLPNQTKSVFEKFEKDISIYVESPKDKLKSYFGLVEELSPITPEVVTNSSAMVKLIEDDARLNLDIMFGDSSDDMAEKIEDMKEFLQDDFLAGINTEYVHVCQVNVNLEQLNIIFASYGGIVSVEETLKVVFSSSTPTQPGDYNVEVRATNRKPIMVADQPVDSSHPLLAPAFKDQIGDEFQASIDDSHGTQVGSLIVYGTRLNGSGNLIVENFISSINILKSIPGGQTLDIDRLTEALELYKDPNDVLVVNLSINAPEYIYERKLPHWITKLIDEYSVKYNCLFTISAGNLFQKNWPDVFIQRLLTAGYPNHFEDELSMILPPADSINALSVGSIAYAATPNSISKQNEPTFITRRGLIGAPSYKYIKPDLVHYDSNYDTSFASEDNGPFMAYPGGGLIRGSGTSFAAPLTAHDAGLLIQAYPEYSVNSIKALLIHFANPVEPTFILPEEPKKLLVGHGIPDIERTLYSLSSASTMIIEDSIQVGMAKRIRIPIPLGIAGSTEKRLRLRKTLVYNPRINPVDVSIYNPIYITAKIIREDGHPVDSSYSNDYLNGAHKTSNVKTYRSVDVSTREHMGEFWEVEVMAEAADEQTPSDYVQNYSIALTLEDIQHADDIDIHQEIQQMIEVEVGVEVEITV